MLQRFRNPAHQIQLWQRGVIPAQGLAGVVLVVFAHVQDVAYQVLFSQQLRTRPGASLSHGMT